MSTMQINTIIPSSFVDGPVQRTVLFAQGCTIHCPGCQSKHTWPLDGGYSVDVNDLAETLILLSEKHHNITLSGGEITLQPEALSELVSLLSVANRHIVLYSGYTWKQLHDPSHHAYPWLGKILSGVEYLVDGPFIRALDDDFVCFRGSRNQMVIDVQATRTTGRLVLVDWDNQLTLSPDGNIYLPAGLADAFSTLGAPAPTRMCGQTRGQS